MSFNLIIIYRTLCWLFIQTRWKHGFNNVTITSGQIRMIFPLGAFSVRGPSVMNSLPVEPADCQLRWLSSLDENYFIRAVLVYSLLSAIEMLCFALYTRWGIITGPLGFYCTTFEQIDKRWQNLAEMSDRLWRYKQQQHSKLLAQFVFKVSIFRFSTRTKTRAPLPDCLPITRADPVRPKLSGYANAVRRRPWPVL